MARRTAQISWSRGSIALVETWVTLERSVSLAFRRNAGLSGALYQLCTLTGVPPKLRISVRALSVNR
jgi:hypothetical protein